MIGSDVLDDSALDSALGGDEVGVDAVVEGVPHQPHASVITQVPQQATGPAKGRNILEFATYFSNLIL